MFSILRVCANDYSAQIMYYPQLATRMRYFKENEKGIEVMCTVMEDMRNDVRISIALNLINDGKFSVEDVARYSELPIEKVKELAAKKSA